MRINTQAECHLELGMKGIKFMHFCPKIKPLVTNDIMKRILCDFAYCFCVEKLQLAQNRPCFQLHSHASVSLLASFNLVQVNLPSAQRLNGLKPNRCLEIKLRS